MTDSVPQPEQTVAPAALDTAAATAPDAAVRPAGASRRGGRGGRGRKPANSSFAAAAATEGDAPAAADGAATARRAPRPIPPTLEKLAELYPQLFGAVFLPLKRGIFQDLQAAHPDLFEREALKLALGIHTRSTRYLQCVAAGQPRHDLQGQPVEDMAPEHVHHALLEVFRRRKPRDGEDLQATLRRRIAQAFETSGLTREAYDALVRGRDDKANALLDEAFAEVAERDAKAEALARAFEASGATPEQFADMYGMDRRAVTQSLARARRPQAKG